MEIHRISVQGGSRLTIKNLVENSCSTKLLLYPIELLPKSWQSLSQLFDLHMSLVHNKHADLATLARKIDVPG